MGREQRKALIAKIEQTRGSKVITYVTGDRENLGFQISPDVVSVVHEHLMAIDEGQRGKLDLFIYSRGGASDVPWTLVSMFREHSQEGSFSVLIPYRAHSAATVIALGADEIVMTKKAELGPIDASMTSGPYNPTEGDTRQRLPVSPEDVTGYFRLLERFGCERPEEKLKGFEQLTAQVHPLALGAVSRLLEETKLVGARLLSTRAEPFTEEENHEIIKKLSSEVYSHNHAISRTEAVKYLGLKQIKRAEDVGIEQELWGLYTDYRDLFSLEEPFRAEEHLVATNSEEQAWTGLNLACVESHARFDLRSMSMKVRRLRDTPPQINVNLNNMTFPQVALPNLPQGITPEQLNAIVQQTVRATVQQALNVSVQNAIKQLIQSLPQKGFQKIVYDSKWETEA